MSTINFINALRLALQHELQQKTSWGRVEVLAAFERALVSTLAGAEKLS